jgi:hypothetical protein
MRLGPLKRADIIILDANPLENISNIRSIRFVVTQGRLFETAKLWESVGSGHSRRNISRAKAPRRKALSRC